MHMERLTHEGLNHAGENEELKEAEKEFRKANKQIIVGQVNLAWSAALAAYLWSLRPEAAAHLGRLLPYVVGAIGALAKTSPTKVLEHGLMCWLHVREFLLTMLSLMHLRPL